MPKPAPQPSAEEIAALASTLFVMADFPEPTQTFIHREMLEMRRLGGRVRVLAERLLPPERAEAALAPIIDDAIFLGDRPVWVARGLAWAARHPARFARAFVSMAALPHRSAGHRARALAMVVAAASVADKVAAEGIGYVHAHFAAYQTELAMALAELLGVPFGVTAHAYDIWKDRNALADKVRRGRVMLTCTEHNAAHLRALAPESVERVIRVYHGLDLQQLPSIAAPPPGPPWRLLAIGRLIQKKGFRFLVEAVAQARSGGLDVACDIVGDGPERASLQEAIDAAGLGDAFTMLGAMPNAAVWQAIAARHVVVAPSIQEADGNIDGIPNVLLEAMAAGRAVIGTRLSGIPEVVRPGETGALCEPGDAASLRAAIVGLLDGPADEVATRLATLGATGRALIERDFDVAANMRRQLTLMFAARQG